MNTVLFDFDGTLIDTHDLIIQGFNHMSMKYRGIPLSKQEHVSMLGKPLEKQLQMIRPHGKEILTEEFQKWYQQNHDHHARPYDDVIDMLQLLKQEGYKIGIVTNNSQEGLQLGLLLLGLEAFFDVIVTRDDVAECKPSPEGIHKALRHLNSRPEECMYVGDSEGDIHAAHAAGVMSVLVGWTSLTQEQIRML